MELSLEFSKAKIAMKRIQRMHEVKDIILKASGKINQKASGDVLIKGSKIKEN